MPKKIELYCDGACSANGKENALGGWGAILKYGDNVKEFSGILIQGYPQTNQRAEIYAALCGLRYVKPEKRKDCDVKIVTDSRYVVETMKPGSTWKRKTNHDLWSLLDNLVKEFRSVNWEWVKGHNDNTYNNRCDELAVAAIKDFKKEAGI